MPKFPTTPTITHPYPYEAGVWYDVAFLQAECDNKDDPSMKESDLWDVIIKRYDPSADAFVYERRADCLLRWSSKSSETYSKIKGIEWRATDLQGGAAVKKGERLVAFMLHHPAVFLFETRLTAPAPKTEAKAND